MPVEIAYEQRGPSEGPPLILSSSLGTTREMWNPQLEALSEHFRVIAYDHRGHGNSPVPDGPYDMKDLADDVTMLMDRLSIEKASFAGLSLGGMVGMWMGVHAADRIDQLALICTLPKIPSPKMWRERAATVREFGTRAMADASIDRWFTSEFQESQSDVVNRFRQMLEDIPDEGYAGCCEAIETLDVARSLPQIAASTLVISGTHDAGAPPDVGSGLANAIPQARYAEVSAAHLASVEASDQVSNLLLEHFRH